MRLRLIQYNGNKWLSYDEDLEQKPVLKCDRSFETEAIGTLYDEDNIQRVYLADGVIARLRFVR